MQIINFHLHTRLTVFLPSFASHYYFNKFEFENYIAKPGHKLCALLFQNALKWVKCNRKIIEKKLSTGQNWKKPNQWHRCHVQEQMIICANLIRLITATKSDKNPNKNCAVIDIAFGFGFYFSRKPAAAVAAYSKTNRTIHTHSIKVPERLLNRKKLSIDKTTNDSKITYKLQ